MKNRIFTLINICYPTLYCMCKREIRKEHEGNLICNALLYNKLKTIAISNQVTMDVSCCSCVMRRNEISERCKYASRTTYRFLFVFHPLPFSCNPSSHLRNSARALTRVFSLTSPSGCIFQIRTVRGRRLRASLSLSLSRRIHIHISFSIAETSVVPLFRDFCKIFARIFDSP